MKTISVGKMPHIPAVSLDGKRLLVPWQAQTRSELKLFEQHVHVLLRRASGSAAGGILRLNMVAGAGPNEQYPENVFKV